ncbi:MAG: YceI family protein [Gammaproteobacteria bacterium]|nr:MAG: YceI family protein [Gammaproteobacteria bacterium]
MKKAIALLLTGLVMATSIQASETYKIDTEGQHAFIQFKIKHLGYSWILGGFNRFSGDFVYDADHPNNNQVKVTIETASIDTNHAKRDKHLRSPDFFDAEKYPQITFTSTGYRSTGKGKGILSGILNLHGVSKQVDLKVNEIGAGKDPWGNFRRGFEASTTLHLSDYQFKKGGMLGPVAENITLFISLEGIRQ